MKRAFTMPEMLVVIGIIVVLIAILFPIIGRVREAANQATCLSRLRQVAQATIMYCGDNEGSFPGAGNGAGQTYPTFGALLAQNYVPFDWIFWDTNAPPPFNDVTQSALAKYMNIGNGDVFRCPSDSLYRPNLNPTPHPGESLYYYSYSFNCYLGNSFPLSDSTAPFPGAYFGSTNHQVAGDHDNKIGQVKHPANIIMFIDEDQRTVNDGAWVVFAYDRLGARHGVANDVLDPSNNPYNDVVDPTGRGNVVFCDGHGEFVPRSEAGNSANYQPY
jgi:prepilin-type N-terminal cleavage/methylation domain-containing protein/prepilin-type processing-associated H-X9-DG protein